jgi:ADP-ribose pyrophosphatase YjhB (NUDIX family)
LLLIKGDKILLLRRFNTGWQDGNYSLPAGHLEMGETPTSGMMREGLEEIGITLHKEDLEMVHTMHRIHGYYIDLFFTAKKWEGEIVNKELNKCDDLNWFPLEDLPINIVPSVKSAIEQYKKGVHFSEFEMEG